MPKPVYQCRKSSGYATVTVSVVDFEYLFVGLGISRICRTAMVILYLSQQTNTCSKSATETLEIAEDNPNEFILKKQPPVVFYKKSVLKYFAKFLTPVPKTLF